MVSPTGAIESQMRQCLKWYRWVHAFAAKWDDNLYGSGDDEAQKKKGKKGKKGKPQMATTAATADQMQAAAPAPWRVHATRPHLIWTTNAAVVCRRCARGSEATAAKHRRAFARTACGGAAAGRLLARLGISLDAESARCRISALELSQKGYAPQNEAFSDELRDALDVHRGEGHDHAREGRGGVDDESKMPEMQVQENSRRPRGQQSSTVDTGETESEQQRPRKAQRQSRLDEPFDERGVTDAADARFDHDDHVPGDREDDADGSVEGDAGEAEQGHSPPRLPPHAKAGKRRRLGDPLLMSGVKRKLPPPEDADDDGTEDAYQQEELHGMTSSPATRQRLSTPTGAPSSSSSATASGSQARGTWLASSSWGAGHKIRVNGPLAFCSACGRYALERVGIGLVDQCKGPDRDAAEKAWKVAEPPHPVGKRLRWAAIPPGGV